MFMHATATAAVAQAICREPSDTATLWQTYLLAHNGQCVAISMFHVINLNNRRMVRCALQSHFNNFDIGQIVDVTIDSSN